MRVRLPFVRGDRPVALSRFSRLPRPRCLPPQLSCPVARTPHARVSGHRDALEHPRRVLATVLVGNTRSTSSSRSSRSGLSSNGSVTTRPDHRTPGDDGRGARLRRNVPKALAVGKPLSCSRLGVAGDRARLLSGHRVVVLIIDSTIAVWRGGCGRATKRSPKPRSNARDQVWSRGRRRAREGFIHNVSTWTTARGGDRDATFARLRPRRRRPRADLRAAHASRFLANSPTGASGKPSELRRGHRLLWAETADPRRLRQLMRGCRSIPKRSGRRLLAEMHSQGREIAAVVDAHGDFAGVVSLEDAVSSRRRELRSHDLDRSASRACPTASARHGADGDRRSSTGLWTSRSSPEPKRSAVGSSSPRAHPAAARLRITAACASRSSRRRRTA